MYYPIDGCVMGKGKGAGSVATQFKPGQVANPGGRPKDIISPLARKYGPEAIATIYGIMSNPLTDEGVRIKAAALLLDRGFGKAREHIELTGAGGGPVQLMAVDGPPQETREQWEARKLLELQDQKKLVIDVTPVKTEEAA